MINPQTKAKIGEREFAKLINEILECNARRTPQSGGMDFKGDLIDINPDSIAYIFHWEVKRQEKLNIWIAYYQALRDSKGTGKIPVVAYRKNNTNWLISIDAKDFLNLLKELEELKNVEKKL